MNHKKVSRATAMKLSVTGKLPKPGYEQYLGNNQWLQNQAGKYVLYTYTSPNRNDYNN